jgi:hypothetical protein
MHRKLTIVAVMFAGLLMLAPSLFAAHRIIVHPSFGFGYHYRPGYFWYPGPVGVYSVGPLTGELKLDTNRKDALVYVDGGYLGIAKKFKNFDLKPGNHDIELRDSNGNILYKERVEIVPGRTTEVGAKGIAG